MIGPQQFRKMKSGATLINKAQSGLIDEKAVAEALRNGTLAAAASTCSKRSLFYCQK